MEKAKLTRAQADALESERRLLEGDTNAMIKVHTGGRGAKLDYDKALNALSNDEYCRALYVGYEIIEEDQVITVTPELRKEIQDYFLEREKDDREWMVGWRRGYKDALALLGIKA